MRIVTLDLSIIMRRSPRAWLFLGPLLLSVRAHTQQLESSGISLSAQHSRPDRQDTMQMDAPVIAAISLIAAAAPRLHAQFASITRSFVHFRVATELIFCCIFLRCM